MTVTERDDMRRFLNRLKILRSLDHFEVPDVRDWAMFRDNPAEYYIRCSDAEDEHIWKALRRREPEPFKMRER